MATQEKQKHGGSLTRPAKGETMNRNGRPRKWVNQMKEAGYKQSEINDCLQTMLALTIEELQTVFEAPESTVLEKAVASAIRNAIKKGTLHEIETLLSRVYGRPVAKAEITGGDGAPLFPVQFVVPDETTRTNLGKLSE